MQYRRNSPLALPFEDALYPSQFLSQITAAAENQLRAQVAAHGNRALGMAVAGAKIIFERGAVQVVFEGGIPVGARLMKAGGGTLPALVDGKTGRILKWGKVASKGRAAAPAAANAALIVVQAAHMISGHDNAQRLKKVESSMDRLVHAHESELRSRLEAIYRYSKELLHHGASRLTDNDRQELQRQCRDLMELRARWRDDFRHQIGKIDRADASWMNKLFWWRREKAESNSREAKAREAEDLLEIIQLTHVCMMMQMTLASCSGRLESFQQLTLPDEFKAWRSVTEFGRRRAEEIAGDSGKAEFAQFLNHLAGVADYWAPLQRENRPLDALAAAEYRRTSSKKRLRRSDAVTLRQKNRMRPRLTKQGGLGRRDMAQRAPLVVLFALPEQRAFQDQL